MALCTDNGVMAAWAGIEKLEQFISNASEGHEPLPRWNIGTLLPDRPGYENNVPLSKRPILRYVFYICRGKEQITTTIVSQTAECWNALLAYLCGNGENHTD